MSSQSNHDEVGRKIGIGGISGMGEIGEIGGIEKYPNNPNNSKDTMRYQNSFRQLVVWQKGKELTLLVYKITKEFPVEERFAMVSQMRRAAYSFLANIAEGNSKKSYKDRCNFFNIAQGSLTELDCFAEIAYELKYISDQDYKKLLEYINKNGYLLNQFIKSQK